MKRNVEAGAWKFKMDTLKKPDDKRQETLLHLGFVWEAEQVPNKWREDELYSHENGGC